MKVSGDLTGYGLVIGYEERGAVPVSFTLRLMSGNTMMFEATKCKPTRSKAIRRMFENLSKLWYGVSKI